jgi:hypothetical protein
MKCFTVLVLTTAPLLSQIKIDPVLHFNGVIGDTSASSLSAVGGHAHDPNNHYAVQGFEPGLNLRVDDWLAGFANINSFTTSDHAFDWEIEEAFLKLQNLPGGVEIRGGRMLNRIGLQNNQHLHAWNLVNSNLTTSRFLGEEGLLTEGAELTWRHDFDRGFFALSTNFGNASSHDPHEEEEEDHGDEDHDDHEGHASENAFMEDNVITTRALFSYNRSDFHQHRFGLNTARGENGYGRETSLHSLDYVYTWRENGLELGGRSFSVGAEVFYRDVEWQGEEDPTNRGSSSQNTWMAFANYRFHPQWIADLRYENQSGALGGGEMHLGEFEYAFESESRERMTLALTREFRHTPLSISTVRLQYSHDTLEEGNADSIWLQFGFDFGGPEVR